MTTKQSIKKIENLFNLNPIYARHVFTLADKNNLIESAKKIIESKPKPFVKWVGGKRQLLKQFKEL
ncbi:MAG: hypothetical protein QG654_407, partial [Patescibacteria group bacterium]|nr:hypothetical protein [Patescibacteria group bacterium]